MPELTNSRFGSSSSSEADGTGVCAARSKCARNRLRISAVSISSAFLVLAPLKRRRDGRADELGPFRWHEPMRHQAETFPQVEFRLGLSLCDLVTEHAGAEGQGVPPVGEPLRGERLGHA